MGTKQIQYKLLREFGEDLIRDIQVSDAPHERDYFHYISGYALGLVHALKLDKSEASNIRTEAKELIVRAEEECTRVRYVHRYNTAVEYIKNRIKCESLDKVLSLASTNEIIDLYETGWSLPDNCDFFDAYENLENKYKGDKDD